MCTGTLPNRVTHTLDEHWLALTQMGKSLIPFHLIGNWTSYSMSNERIKEAMILMYVTILQRWSDTNVDPTRMLLLCLVRQLYGTQILSRQRPQNSHLQVLRYIPFAAGDEDSRSVPNAHIFWTIMARTSRFLISIGCESGNWVEDMDPRSAWKWDNRQRW